MNSLKYIPLSLILSTSLLLASQDLDESLSQDHTYEKQAQAKQALDIGAGWKVFGDLRTGWLEYGYGNPPPGNSSINQGHKDSKGIYVIPKLSIQSPYYNGFMFKATLAGATDFGINDPDYESRNFVFDGSDNKSFVILQESFFYYETKHNKVLVGREELTTPMIDADDWYMLSNSFELARYQNSSIDDITFDLGYFYKMSGVWDSGANGTEFHSMSDASFIDSADKLAIKDTGIFFGAFNYNDEKNHNLEVWDYYAQDMYNTVFVQYDYTDSVSSFKYDFGLQYMNFKEVGYLATDAASTKIDYSLYSARFDGNFDNGINFATGYAKYTDGQGQGATLGAFGGYPYFANGMIFHFFEAGSLQNAASYKAQVGYNILDNLWLGYRYTYFDLDPTFSQNANGQTQNAMKLNGIRLSYGGEFGGYFTGTYENVDLDNEPNTYSLRLIGGYKF